MRSELLKRFDTFIGPLLVRLFKKGRQGAACHSPGSALLIRPGGIGDAVLLVPAIRALQNAHPGCAIDILAESRNASLFGLVPGIRKVYRYHTLAGLGAAFTRRYDLAIDTEQWYRLSAVVARLTRAPMRIGFASNERERLFTHPVSYSLEQFEASSFFRLLEPLGIKAQVDIAIPFLTLPGAAVEAAQVLLAPLAGKPFLAVFPGASILEKQWGTGNFRALAVKLAAGGGKVVIVGGEDTRAAGEEIAKDGIALNLAGRSSLAVSGAILSRAQLLVGGDSGVLHLASALGVPIVSIFGPSDPVKWGPKSETDRVISRGLFCSPCSSFGTTPKCPSRTRCLGEIAVAEVAQACEALLASKC